MSCSILLLLSLTSCVCAGTFVVNGTQTSYQAEEDANVTLEWTFTVTDRPLIPLYIYCEHITDYKNSGLFHLRDGVEVPESQDGQFAGRVQCDKDVLRDGRIRLHVSRLRTADSGLYLCEVLANCGGSFGGSRLNVTAGVRPKDERQKPTSRGTSTGHCGFALTAVPLYCFALYFL